jgi:hypothetical protein
MVLFLYPALLLKADLELIGDLLRDRLQQQGVTTDEATALLREPYNILESNFEIDMAAASSKLGMERGGAKSSDVAVGIVVDKNADSRERMPP